MSAAEQWTEKVLAGRTGRMQHQQKIWDRIPGWYDTWVENNDYVEQVLPYLLPLINQHSNILEIGPGTGAFTVPLARRCSQLIAVEPSSGMRAALQANLNRHALTNVQIHPECIENSLQCLNQEPFDLVFASYALYDVEDILPVLKAWINLTPSLIILLGTGETVEWHRDLCWKLGQEPRAMPPQLDLLQPILAEAGIHSETRILQCTNNYVFHDEKGLLDWWMDNLGLEISQRDQLAAALDPLVERKNASIGIYSSRSAALVRIQGRKTKEKFVHTEVNQQPVPVFSIPGEK